MPNFNLRNITPKTMAKLKKEAEKQKISVNSLILQIVEQGLGNIIPRKKSLFHDLDHLAGTWSKEDESEFNKNIESFEKGDKQVWNS